MSKNKILTVDYVALLLKERKLLTEEQTKELLVKEDVQHAKLKKLQDSFHSSKRSSKFSSKLSSKKSQKTYETISPAEIIASFNFEVPGISGISKKKLTEDMITEIIADDVGMPYKKIDPLKLDLDVVTAYIPRPFAQRYLIIPTEKNEGVLTVAIADPFNLEAVENLKRTKKISLDLVLSSKTDILKIVREFYGFRYSVVAAEKESSGSSELGNLEQYVKLKGSTDIEATDKHIVNAVEYLLSYAYEQRASDIHIEPKREKSHVRLRIDGVLHHIHTIPKAVHPSMTSRIKMLSRMDIAEKRRPQDGRIKTSYRGKDVELRVSTLPTAFGEKIVIRIFDPDILFQELKDLGFYPREYEVFNSFLKKTYGIILVTGPTGSGKTTTLYSALKFLSSPEVNIITIEDPIEMVVEEFNQVGVMPQIGVDFAGSLRTILRQDPDIIMVGEIRDAETVNNAVQAALTGHLVLSTLHTNDAPSSITRLLDLGVPAFLISSSVLGIIAQRLVRKICNQCKKERMLKPEEIGYLGIENKAYYVFYGEGCADCRGTGYKGRTGIYEIMPMSEKINSLLSESADTVAIKREARAAGMITLKEAAIKKMLEGSTTYEEVVSVSG